MRKLIIVELLLTGIVFIVLAITAQQTFAQSATLLEAGRNGGEIRTILSSIWEAGMVHTTILQLKVLGLANRLRTLAGVYSIARGNGGVLFAIWHKNDHCPAAFHELFTSTVHDSLIILSVDDSQIRDFYITFNAVLQKFLEEHQLSMERVVETQFQVDYFPHNSARNITLFITAGSHAPADLSCSAFLHRKSLFYRGLVPVQPVKTLVDSIIYSKFLVGGQVVGIHMRAYDSDHDWPMVVPHVAAISRDNDSYVTASAPSMQQEVGGTGAEDAQSFSNAAAALRFDEVATLAHFVSTLDRIAAVNKNIRFYVASNSLLAKQAIAKHFGEDSIISLFSDAIGDRSSLAGLQLALADMLLLGETALVLHTTQSSFAREAASFHMKPVIDVRVSLNDAVCHACLYTCLSLQFILLY